MASNTMVMQTPCVTDTHTHMILTHEMGLNIVVRSIKLLIVVSLGVLSFQSLHIDAMACYMLSVLLYYEHAC